MGLCKLVVALADALAKAKSPLQARQRLLVEILRLMPLYAEGIANLSAWESAFQDAHPERPDESEVGELLEKIFEFARYNMYTVFDAAKTYEYYVLLSADLMQAGVESRTVQAIPDW